MKLTNLTSHPLKFFTPSGVLELPPSGQLARVFTHSTPIGELAGMAVVRPTFGEITGLPDPAPDHTFVVSQIVLTALKAAGIIRSDVVAPDTTPVGGAIRDAQGRVQGVTRLLGM
ncbi:hypothetical protein [Pseudomonas sp. RL]|uniref:hypothetical protein n=1 Tax=Pseudomonas sp. RL TaxID=1452718 RepID=UPI00055B2041|nr:hypothetical protein [Pseudomonas sp. RL]